MTEFEKNKNKAPLVSIIIPTYNRLEYLKSCLASVSKQSLQDWECLVIDDGSSDATVGFLNECIKQDGRFKYFSRPDYYPKGAVSCRNYGLILSRGEFIQWLDDDDLISYNKLELQVRRLKEFPNEQCFTTCSWDLYWPNKNLELKYLLTEDEFLYPENFFQKLFDKQTFIPASAYLTPRSITFSAGMWNQTLSLNDDAEYFTRVLLSAEKLIMTNDCYVLYREHSNERISTQKDEKSLKSFLLSLHLIYSHLLSYEIKAKDYFKWKLKIIFQQYSLNFMHVLLLHKSFFLENGIDLRFSDLLRWRIKIFKFFYPVIKKTIKSRRK